MLLTCKLFFSSIIVLLYDARHNAAVVAAAPKTRMFVEAAAVGAKQKSDNVDEESAEIRRVYDCALRLLVFKMKAWVKSVADNDGLSDPDAVVDAISVYLGFPRETIRVIDDAFTELVYRHVVTRTLRIDHLGAAFLYACDVGHMVDGGGDSAADRVANVRENFELIFENLGVAAAAGNDDDYAVRGEEALVRELRDSVAAVARPVDRWNRVSIGLVKNRLFVGPSDNATVRDLRSRFIRDYRTRLAATFETETNVLKAVLNHVKILRIVIPDLFGFAYNHVVLLTELRKYDLRDTAAAVSGSAPVLPLVAAIFVKRHFEYIRADDRLLFKRDMFRFLDFFDPTREYSARPVSIGEYRTLDGDDGHAGFKSRLWAATDSAIRRMLDFYAVDFPETWKTVRSIRFAFVKDETVRRRDHVLAAMAENTRNAEEFLAEIKRKCGLDEDGDDTDDYAGEYARLRESIDVPLGPDEQERK